MICSNEKQKKLLSQNTNKSIASKDKNNQNAWKRVSSARQQPEKTMSNSKQRSNSSYGKHSKLQTQQMFNRKPINSINEMKQLSYSIDLNISKNEKQRLYRSIDLQDKSSKRRYSTYLNNQEQGSMNNKYMTIKPWLNRNDNPALKRQVNLFEFYMNELKRKRDEKSLKKSMNFQEANSSSPILIKSVADNFQGISEKELNNMEKLYKQWKNKSRMLISGKSINGSTYKNTRKPKQAQQKQKEKKGCTGGFTVLSKSLALTYQPQKLEEVEIQGWQGDKNVDNFDYTQFS